MAGYSIERAQLGPHEVVVLRDAARGRSACIARRGATLIGLEQMAGGAMHALLDGYRDASELDARPSSRSAIMAPFANRIADARYAFDGQAHDLQPGVEKAQRASRHGFVRGVDFDIAGLQSDADAAQATFATAIIRPGAFAGYPYAVDLAVTYTLDANGLALHIRMRNAGDVAAPCFFGWHPYFRVGHGAIDAWELQIPAATLIRTDDQYIPLPGADAYQPLDDAPPQLDFRKARPIGPIRIDNAYAHLARDGDGRSRTRLRDPASGIAISVWQERGVMLAFTADTITRDVRGSVALEPMESLANAFNRDDCADAIHLAPGAERIFRCGVEIESA